MAEKAGAGWRGERDRTLTARQRRIRYFIDFK
jgi:hypothetical protein